MTWLDENPFPPAEGVTIYKVLATWRGTSCSTEVIGMPRVHWTMNHFDHIGYDDIRFKENGNMADVATEEKVAEVAKTPVTALEAITAERARQDTKWGEQNHDGMKWVLIAVEELGELSESLLKGERANYIAELTQLAAVTLAWLECEYRRKIVEADDAPVKRENGLFQWNGIVSMERDETKGSQSPMWRCLTADGEKVNVFKHKDASRDTFHLFDDAGYGAMMELMKLGDVLTWKAFPIHARLKMENGWWTAIEVEKMPVGAKPEIGRDDAKAKAEAAAWAKALIESDDFVILDTETTGLNRELDEPVSICVIDKDGKVLFESLVNPSIPVDVEASAIHGLSNGRLETEPTYPQVRDKFFAAIKDKTVVIYNEAFDTAILTNADNACVPDDWKATTHLDFGAKGWQCAMEQYANFYGEWNPHRAEYKNQTLTKACEQQGITVDLPVHSAFGDCLHTLALIKKMAEYKEVKSGVHPF